MPDCRSCRQPFTIDARARAFYLGRALALPERCAPCRRIRRELRAAGPVSITCKRCRRPFEWSAYLRLQYRLRGYSEPRTCPSCRDAIRRRTSIRAERIRAELPAELAQALERAARCGLEGAVIGECPLVHRALERCGVLATCGMPAAEAQAHARRLVGP